MEFERFPIDFNVEVHALKGVIRHYLGEVCLRDVSGGGVCFFSICPDMYSIGQRLFLSIRLQGIFDMAFSLIGMIPFLLAVYVIMVIHADITQGMMLAAAAVFCSHLLGLTLLRRSGNKLQTLGDRVRMALTAKGKETHRDGWACTL